ETKKCTRCNCDRPLVDFFGDKDVYSGCKTCCNSKSQAKKRKRQEIDNCMMEKENVVDLLNITDHIYNSLLSNKDVNDDFKGQTRFQLEFNVNSESIDETLVNTEQDKNLSIANLVINEISNGDGYSYVHQSTYNSKKQDFVKYTYWCNARNELHKHYKKVSDKSRQCSTEAYIERYN
ncbi:343_t:CDS:1, partial [Ambispora leptoticha]